MIGLLRADLAAAPFTVDALTRLWGETADAALARGHRVPALRALGADRSPLATLARLFLLGLPVRRDALAQALPALGTDGAAGLGLVGYEGDHAHPLLDLRPYAFVDARGVGSWWILSDLGELALGHELREDHVLGVGGASLTLAGLMLHNPVDTVLDLGTGCGIQAMHASRHARRVVATDISERALTLARMNAELNGIDRIEFRRGSLFEPVAGERFDQIVSNPPFVITPRVESVPGYEYRDGGLVGDGIMQHVVRQAEAHLAPGGTAQLLGNWEYRGAVPGLDRVGAWLDGSGLDAWVIERELQDTALYAETWIRDGGLRPGPTFDTLYGAWLDDFDRRGVTQVGLGFVLLRAPEAARPRWRRLERVRSGLGEGVGGLGEHLAGCLAARDRAASLDDDGLARAALTVAVDVTEERHYWPGADDPTVMLLRQGSGFGRTVTLDTGLAAVVGACDGSLSVRAISDAVAELMGVDAHALLGQVLPRIRELLETGFLRF